MRLAVGELRDFLEGLGEDWEVCIEYPERYGLAQPTEIETGAFDDQDFIPAVAFGFNEKKKKVYIFHHY